MTEGTPFHERSGMDRYGENAMAGDLAESKVEKVLADLDRSPATLPPKLSPSP